MIDPLWKPDQKSIDQSHMSDFMRATNIKYNLTLSNYEELYQWSINCPDLFWKMISDFCGIIYSKPATKIIQTHEKIWKTKWFIDATFNFSENLLKHRDERIALIYVNESDEQKKLSYHDLFLQVEKIASYLITCGVKKSDRVAGFVSNCLEAVVAMLATSSLGAIWTACGPEFGLSALIDRFSQIKPVVLFAITSHSFQGKIFNHEKLIQQLQEKLPSIAHIILIPTDFHAIISQKSTTPLSFLPLPFDHPLYILYSSGTTGKPKCMVHGAGNILIQHLKELMLHTDLHASDTLFFYTTCSWMMWHWMISGLAVGVTLVLYDGSPLNSPALLFDLIDQFDVSVFGCGAKIIETYLKNNLKPKQTHVLKNLKTILTTGSPLLKDSFDYLYRDVKKEMRVSSISGGSDLVSCFALGNPLLPVYAEELQCRGLGMGVAIFDDTGNAIKNKPGELVCTNAFPTMPLYFWNDLSDEKYYHAYFDQFSNVWTQGDYAKITRHDGLIIYGRSDATLNPGGIRIGTADIYEQVLKIAEVMDCVAAGQQFENDEQIILFVKLKNNLTLDEALITVIKKMIRDNTTPFHVPKKIIQVQDIPKTMNGKTMEMVVKNIINKKAVKNTEALVNPECLKQFQELSGQLL